MSGRERTMTSVLQSPSLTQVSRARQHATWEEGQVVVDGIGNEHTVDMDGPTKNRKGEGVRVRLHFR